MRGLWRAGLWVVALLAAPVAAQGVPTRIEVVASNLNHPWGLAFLPGGGVLVTERNGGLRRIEGGKMTAIAGVPKVYNEGQGGLFDVLPHPEFASNRLLFLSYAAGTDKANATTVARARLDGNKLADVQVIWAANPAKDAPVHFGGRMAWLPDGTLLLTTGDNFDDREKAQLLDSPLGKVMRITQDGRSPGNNPFVGKAGARTSIWSFGHRNPQGIAFDPVRRLVFAHEHGPRGGDEVNIIKPGNNYGWPVATHGKDYSGATISPYKSYKGMQDALLGWTPSIAPSGLAVYRGAMFPEWQGDLLVGALVDREVRRVRLSADGERVIGQESLFRELGERIRDVRVAPDGSVWLTSDSEKGKVLRISRR